MNAKIVPEDPVLVEKISDRANKCLRPMNPHAVGAIAQHHLGAGSIPAAFEGFHVQATAEQFGSFDRARVGG